VQQQLRLGDPALPFIILHNEVTIPAKSFIRIPVRFVPVESKKFDVKVHGQILGFPGDIISIQFSGNAI
jgi:hypothetical protein